MRAAVLTAFGSPLAIESLPGSFAEQVRVPTENAFRIGPIDEADAGAWCAVNTALVRSGLLDLGQFEVTDFKLEEVNEAAAHAAAHAGPFRMTVIRPGLS